MYLLPHKADIDENAKGAQNAPIEQGELDEGNVVYFAEFEIRNYEEESITVRGPSFDSEIGAEQNLHALCNRFMPDTDDEWLRGPCIWKEVLPPPPELQSFSDWLNTKSNPDIVREYNSDITQWTPRAQ